MDPKRSSGRFRPPAHPNPPRGAVESKRAESRRGSVSTVAEEDPPPSFAPGLAHSTSRDAKEMVNAMAQIRKQESMRTVSTPEADSKLRGGSGYVTSVALSLDGRRAVTGRNDNTAIYWDTETRTPCQIFKGHNDTVTSVAIAANMLFIVTGSADHTAKVWSPEDPAVQGTLPHPAGVVAVGVSADSAYIVTACEDRVARVWNPANGEKLRELPHEAAVTALATFSGDALRVATGTAAPGGGSVRIWNALEGQELRSFPLPSPVTSLAAREDGSVLVAGREDGVASLWSGGSGSALAEARHLQSEESGAVRAVAVSRSTGPGDDLVAVGGEDTKVRVWKLSTGRFHRVIDRHAGVVVAAAMSKDGRLLLTGSRDGTADLTDLERTVPEQPSAELNALPRLSPRSRFSGRRIRTLFGHTKPVVAVAIAQDSSFIVTGSDDGLVRLWEAGEGQPIILGDGESGHSKDQRVKAVAISHDGSFIVSTGNDRKAIVWDTASRTVAQILAGHGHDVKAVAISADDRYVVTGCQDMLGRVYERDGSGQWYCKTKLVGHKERVTCVAIADDASFAVTGSYDGTLHKWSLDGELLKTREAHNARVTSVAISRGNEFIVSGSWDSTAKRWDAGLDFIQRSYVGHRGTVTSVAIRLERPGSAEKGLLLTGSWDGTAKVWDLRRGEELRTLDGHREGVKAVAISADGKIYLTGSTDGQAKLWPINTGEEGAARVKESFERIRGKLMSHKSAIQAVAISPHCDFIITGHEDSTAKLWDAGDYTARQQFTGHRGEVNDVTISSDAALVSFAGVIVTGSDDGTACVWKLNGKKYRELSGHTGAVEAVAMSPRREYVATGSKDHTAILWDWENEQPLCILTEHTDRVSSVAFAGRRGEFLFTTGYDNAVFKWAVPTGALAEAPAGFMIRGAHESFITTIAVSPDEKLVVTGGWDATAKVWSSKDANELVKLGGREQPRSHRGTVTGISVAQDDGGYTILTSSWDNTCKVWRLPLDLERWDPKLLPKEPVYTLLGHADSVKATAIARNGTFFVTGGNDATAIIWSSELEGSFRGAPGAAPVAARKRAVRMQVRTLEHKTCVNAVAISSDGTSIATGTNQPFARVWSTVSTAAPLQLEGHSGRIKAVAFAPDDSFVVTGGADGKALIHREDEEPLALEGHKERVNGVAVSEPVTVSGKARLRSLVVTCSTDKTAKVWDSVDGELLCELLGHGRWIKGVAVTLDARFAATASVDETAKVWDLRHLRHLRRQRRGVNAAEEICTLRGHSGTVNSVAIAGSGEFVITGSWDCTVKVWSLRGELVRTLQHHKKRVNAVCLSRNDFYAVSSSEDMTAVLWDVAAGEVLRVLAGHTNWVKSVAISADGLFIVTGSEDTSVRVWESSTSEEVAVLGEHSDWVLAVAISDDGKLIVTGSNDTTAILWKVPGWSKKATLDGHEQPVCCVAISPTAIDAPFIVTGSEDCTARVWELNGQLRCVLSGHSDALSEVMIMADGLSIFTSAENNTMRAWDPRSGEVMEEFDESSTALQRGANATLDESGADAFECAAVSPCGTYIAIGRHDGAAKLWNWKVTPPKLVHTFTHTDAKEPASGERATVTAVAISQKFVVTGSIDHVARVWDAGSGKLRHTLGGPAGHVGVVKAAAISADDAFVVTASSDKSVKVWDLHSGALLRSLELHRRTVNDVAISSDGLFIVSASNDNTAQVWSNLVRPDFRAIAAPSAVPPSPMVVNDFFLTDLRESQKNLDYDWPRFRGADEGILRELCAANGLDALHIYEGEREMLENKKEATTENLLHLAVAKGADQLLSDVLLPLAPHAALCAFRARLPSGEHGEVTLLGHALETNNAVVIGIVLDVLVELLTMPASSASGEDLGKRQYVRKNSPLLPYLNNFEPRGKQLGAHAGDAVDINEICKVAKDFPDLFLSFAERLTLVPQYKVALGRKERRRMSFDMALLPSEERAAEGFWDEDSTRDPWDGWDTNFHEVVEVSPWLVPVANIAGPDSRFLEAVVSSALRIGKFQGLENEVIGAVVKFKWRAFVKSSFQRDLALFFAFAIVFAVHALTYAYLGADAASGTFVGLAALVVLYFLWAYFAAIEVFQLVQSVTKKALHRYARDLWNWLDLFSLGLQLAALVAQTLSYFGGGKGSAAVAVSAAAVPTLAFQLLFYLQGFVESGALVRMTVKITRGIVIFCLVLLIFIVAFAAAFTLLFQRGRGGAPDEYASYGDSVFSMFRALLGDWDITVFKDAASPELAQLLLALYIFVTGIVLLNLLIAIMADKFDEVQEHTIAEATYARACLILEYESRMSKLARKAQRTERYPKWIQVLRTGSTEELTKRNWDRGSKTKWQGRIRAIRRAMDEQLHRLKKATERRLGAMEERLDSQSAQLKASAQRLEEVGTAMEEMLALMRAQRDAADPPQPSLST